MKLFCRLLGHTWQPVTRAPNTRWNTTKDGHTLVGTNPEGEIAHLLVCLRCGEERPDRPRRHDREHDADQAVDGAREPAPSE